MWKTTEKQIKLAFLISVAAPYRMPFYKLVSEDRPFSLKLFVEKAAPDWRPGWRISDSSGIYFELVKSIIFSVPRKSRKDGEKRVVSLAVDLLPRLIRFRPDIVVSQEFGIRTLLAMIYKMVFKKKLIISVDGTDHSESSVGKLRRYERKWIAGYADGFLAASNGGKTYLGNLGVDPRKIAVVPLVTDNDRFFEIPENKKVTNEKKEGLNFLYVGRLVESKGVKELLSAWKKLPESKRLNSLLTFVGWGPYEPVINEVAQKERSRIVFKGRARYEEMQYIYKKSDFFVFPTHIDTWGLVVNEALAAGLPVLCSKYAGAHELILHRKNGYIFDPLKEEDILNALNWAFDNKEQLGKLRKQSVDSIKDFNYLAAYENFKRFVLQLNDDD